MLGSLGTPMNLAALSVQKPADYLLGPGDTVEVSVAGLSDPGPNERTRPIQTQVMADGTIRLPMIERVHVEGMNLSQAQAAIDQAYSQRTVKNPKTSVILVEKASLTIPVLGEVTEPGVQSLPKYENDVAHAIASAGGFSPFSAEVIEVHRRINEVELARYLPDNFTTESLSDAGGELLETAIVDPTFPSNKIILRIPLKAGHPTILIDEQVIPQPDLQSQDVVLRQGDVVVVPRQPDEVFFVVGPLSTNNVVNFRVSELDRRLGNAFLLPQDRDVDVVTAVAMAGYIDPIDSPSTVTVHRSVPGCPPKLIHVDLIAARYDWKENVYIQPGDIVYLNPDAAWWWRRTFDRVVPDLITIPYAETMLNWINPRRVN